MVDMHTFIPSAVEDICHSKKTIQDIVSIEEIFQILPHLCFDQFSLSHMPVKIIPSMSSGAWLFALIY